MNEPDILRIGEQVFVFDPFSQVRTAKVPGADSLEQAKKKDPSWVKEVLSIHKATMKKYPFTKTLWNKLVAISGWSVCLPTYPQGLRDCKDALKRGSLFPTKGAIYKPMYSSQCHANIALLYKKDERLRIIDGFCLDADGMWREHTWGLSLGGKVIETTAKRLAYFGYMLTPQESKEFVKANPVPKGAIRIK